MTRTMRGMSIGPLAMLNRLDRQADLHGDLRYDGVA
jgi:hypothetical protein